jgi:hypothetical protein
MREDGCLIGYVFKPGALIAAGDRGMRGGLAQTRAVSGQ